VQTQAITVELQLAGMTVLDVREETWTVEVAARYEAEEAACPSLRSDDPADAPVAPAAQAGCDLWEKMVYVLLWKRRFHCAPADDNAGVHGTRPGAGLRADCNSSFDIH